MCWALFALVVFAYFTESGYHAPSILDPRTNLFSLQSQEAEKPIEEVKKMRLFWYQSRAEGEAHPGSPPQSPGLGAAGQAVRSLGEGHGLGETQPAAGREPRLRGL